MALLHYDFIKVLNDTLIPKGSEGWLPRCWEGGHEESSLTEKKLKEKLNPKKSIRDIMNKLKISKACYVSRKRVMKKTLVGEILKIDVIKKYKKEIEDLLSESKSKSKKLSKNDIQLQGVSKEDINEIWKELTKKRALLIEKK